MKEEIANTFLSKVILNTSPVLLESRYKIYLNFLCIIIFFLIKNEDQDR